MKLLDLLVLRKESGNTLYGGCYIGIIFPYSPLRTNTLMLRMTGLGLRFRV